ncbi:metal ion transporter [Fusarium mundagurra]|uniref:Metal ion transporter n=1 Tax=Fusarium mundagurra TaxID=1567541 RepID=A0A8H5XPZ1_9HYPO|nr:metal ion transporter [Fusarium mundagurra]
MSQEQASGQGFFNLPNANLSDTSINSEVLLDHRDHQSLGPRRASTAPAQGPNSPFTGPSGNYLQPIPDVSTEGEHEKPTKWDKPAPLLGETVLQVQTGLNGYGASDARSSRPRTRQPFNKSPVTRLGISSGSRDCCDVNHPPSMPGSPAFGTTSHIELSLGDVMILNESEKGFDNFPHRLLREVDSLSDLESGLRDTEQESCRRVTTEAKQDICSPAPGISEIGDNEVQSRAREPRQYRTRRRCGQWPDLSILEEWSRMERGNRIEENRVKRITEATVHRWTALLRTQTISELVQPGGSFRELFIPDPRIVSDNETGKEDLDPVVTSRVRNQCMTVEGESKIPMRQPSMSTACNTIDTGPEIINSPSKDSLANVASRSPADESKDRIMRYGERPVWWLDVLCPTEPEMKVISSAFGIHPLTAEDIMLQEAREKVEHFWHYYFVNYRSFGQDHNSEIFLRPVDMYVVIFQEGVLSFHFSKAPHRANVRRRIRQLWGYLILSSDWILYAIIDDITHLFQSLLQNIEDEVDEIDDSILKLHTSAGKRLKEDHSKPDNAIITSDPNNDMLRRVGECRKKVMSLYRLLGNKVSVIKGVRKRCSERWEPAPRSEIGLYLGDIQDHIVTMTTNLGYYEE